MKKELTSIHSTVWENNAGCVILANLELPYMTPRLKVEKIDGDFQLADILTKALRTDKFERLCKLLMGW